MLQFCTKPSMYVYIWTHLPLVTHICSVNWVGIGSCNGLSPVRRQAITWSNGTLLSIEPLWTNFSEIWIKNTKISFMKMHLKLSPAKWRPFCPGVDDFKVTGTGFDVFFVSSLTCCWTYNSENASHNCEPVVSDNAVTCRPSSWGRHDVRSRDSPTIFLQMTTDQRLAKPAMRIWHE